MPSFHGQFEAHVTVGPRDAGRAARLAREHGWKFAEIVLDRGRHPAQPMLTVRASGTLADAHTAADAVAAEVGGAVRVKIEAAPGNAGVPGTDAEAARLGPAFYFEHHVKLLLGPDADTAALTALAVAHRAHLSRNARRVRPDGLSERFVTQRRRGEGTPTARARLDALVGDLTARGHAVVAVEREFVVYDSRAELDSGWIEET